MTPNTPVRQTLEDVSITVLESQCPMLTNRSSQCNYGFLSQYVDGDEQTMRNAIFDLAQRLQNLSIDEEYLARIMENRSLSTPVHYTLIVLYTVLIVCGTVVNSLVMLAVLRKDSMKTAPNMFILNLAVSDLLLCLVTSPSTLVEILTKHWPLGSETASLCKLFGGVQGVCVFVSSISITAIALDRYYVILYPNNRKLRLIEVNIILVCIWAVAILFASPMFIIRQLNSHKLTHTLPNMSDSVNYCFENWSTEMNRLLYSLFSMLCQYVVPIVTVSVTYFRITRKLRSRMRTFEARASVNRRLREVRSRRTNQLLFSIAIIYAVSWIPLNVFNLVSDLIEAPISIENRRIIYAICHMMAMSSACSNPVIYGWFNKNFRKEFIEIFQIMLRVWRCSAQAANDRTTSIELVPQKCLAIPDEQNN